MQAGTYLVLIESDAFIDKAAATSFGKSLCFQLPAVIDHGITIVISPLLALVNNQVAALQAADIAVATLNSNTLFADRTAILDDLCCGIQISHDNGIIMKHNNSSRTPTDSTTLYNP